MNDYLDHLMVPPRLRGIVQLNELLFTLALEAREELRRRGEKPRQRTGKGETLRPGMETPLWNQLSREILAQLNHRGDRARLARILGLPRQRVTEFLRSRRGCPDAERTLLLLAWLLRKLEKGPELSPEGIGSANLREWH